MKRRDVLKTAGSVTVISAVGVGGASARDATFDDAGVGPEDEKAVCDDHKSCEECLDDPRCDQIACSDLC